MLLNQTSNGSFTAQNRSLHRLASDPIGRPILCDSFAEQVRELSRNNVFMKCLFFSPLSLSSTKYFCCQVDCYYKILWFRYFHKRKRSKVNVAIRVEYFAPERCGFLGFVRALVHLARSNINKAPHINTQTYKSESTSFYRTLDTGIHKRVLQKMMGKRKRPGTNGELFRLWFQISLKGEALGVNEIGALQGIMLARRRRSARQRTTKTSSPCLLFSVPGGYDL